jgi:TonB-linked SusC/RagA family outer membrane protein
MLTVAGALCLAVATSAFAQQVRRITGRVTATTGEPIARALVNVQGSPTGTYTADDGRFTIANAGEGAKVLTVRHFGFKRATVNVAAGQNDVTVQLEKDALELESVVVTGTATTVSSANAAQAVSRVSAEQLNKTPTPVLENALQAKIPGAIITTNSGAPGGGSQVQLRGTTSINSNVSPLYVVDGVLVNNSQLTTGLNSVTNAGGGIASSQDQMVNRIADINPADIENIEVLKGASAGAIYGSKAAAGVIIITTKKGAAGKPVVNVAQRLGNFSLAHELGVRCFGSQQEAMDWAGVTTAAALPSPWSPTCHDFEKEYYSGNGMSYETDLSVRGGTAGGTTYYVGGLGKRDNGIAKASYYQKQALTANLGQPIGTKLTLDVNNQIIHSLTDRGISGNDNSPIVSPGDVFSGTPSFFDLSSGARNPWLTEGTNPFQNASRLKAPEEVFRYIGGAHLTWNAWANDRQTLDFSFTGGLDTYSDRAKIISPADLYFEPADGLPGTVVFSDGTTTQGNLNFSGVHKFTFDYGTATTSAGLRKEQRQIDQVQTQGRNVPAGAQNVQLAGQIAVNEGITVVKDYGIYAQEEFLTLSDRLLLTAATNAERSSVNGDDQKLYSYPKFAASYRIPWLPPKADEIKIRAAYGKAGNQPPYGYKFTSLAVGVNDGTLGARPSTIAGNPAIKPETSNETEGGFDAQFANGRIALSATYFNKKVTDLILSAAVAPSTGFSTKYVNGGTLVNKGTELSLDMTPVQNDMLQWISRTTFYSYRGKVTQLTVPSFTPGVGSFGTRYGSPWIEQGRSPTVIRVVNSCSVTVATGATCPSASRVLDYIESAPDYQMGFSNTLNIKDFSIDGLVEWRKGGYAINLTQNYFDETGLGPDTAAANAAVIAWNAGKAVYVQPAGFVKLREINLAYKVPKSFTTKYFSQAHDVRLELSGRNLFRSTKYGGYDPEVSNFSNQPIGRFQDVTPYPPWKSFFFSVIANF